MHALERSDFHRRFKTNGCPAILPVIHARHIEQVLLNIAIATSLHAQGVFIINHDFSIEMLIPILHAVRKKYPNLWLGVNFLATTGLRAFPILSTLQEDGTEIDAYWADDACINEQVPLVEQEMAQNIQQAYDSGCWHGLYFGGTCFKKQRPVDPGMDATAAELASNFMHVVTTSGSATGVACDTTKIATFRKALGSKCLALASGVTPENVGKYVHDVDAILVSTGINFPGDFYNIDPARLAKLVSRAKAHTCDYPRHVRDDVFLRMAPNVKGPKYAWLDPSSAYANASGFHALVDALASPFMLEDVDVVAGIDAAGFVLGAAVAYRLNVGFLNIRKAGKLPVPTIDTPYVNYTGKEQHMEMRSPGIREKQRVLIVDQWVETGGSMDAAIRLIEQQGGVIVGLAAICMEKPGREHLGKYRCVSAVEEGSELQQQFDAQHFSGFDNYDWNMVLP